MESIWSKTCSIEERDVLRGDMDTEAVVIGGGITGILTAHQLEQAGMRTVVLEAERIGSGQTKGTTAKITAQHGMFCSSFLGKMGEEAARKYVQANLEAVKEYKKIISENGIECDLEEMDSYVYSKSEKKLKEEVEAACRLGAPASYEKEIEIPVECAGAVRFKDQAQFHPLKFLRAVSGKLKICEGSPVSEVTEHTVRTPCGSVHAEHIIFASHFPFVNFPGMYFTRMHQERSYVLALEGLDPINGMYIGDEEETLSFRQYQGYLLLGGQSHRTGKNKTGGKYEELREAAKTLYPSGGEAAAWSAQDCITADKVPFIGRYSAERPNWLVASGFQKWGMSSAMAAAMMIRDMICGKENPYQEVFAPDRLSVQEIPQILKDSGTAVKGLTKRFFHLPGDTVSMIPPGHGAIVAAGCGKVGVYKAEDEEIFQVDVVCPHLGCELVWNPDERTWDCPCHGSRFDYEGNLLEGPAQEDVHHE